MNSSSPLRLTGCRTARSLAAVCLLAALSTAASAVTITGNFDPTGAPVLSRLLAGSGIDPGDISDFVFTGATSSFAQSGLFDQLTIQGAGQTTLTLGSGIVLSSGSVTNLPTSNTTTAYSNITSTGGNNYFRDFPAQTGTTRHGGRLQEHDENSLVFDFDAPANATALRAQFVYASDEFPEWSGTSFADGFAFFVDDVNYALLPDGRPVSLLRPEDNIHFLTNGDPFDLTTPSVAAVEYDGLTRVLTLTAPLKAGHINSIAIVVADTGDEIYDSAAFISSFELLTAPVTVPEPSDPSSAYRVRVRSSSQDAAFVELSSPAPVPEPGTAGYLLGCLLGAGLRRRRRVLG